METKTKTAARKPRFFVGGKVGALWTIWDRFDVEHGPVQTTKSLRRARVYVEVLNESYSQK